MTSFKATLICLVLIPLVPVLAEYLERTWPVVSLEGLGDQDASRPALVLPRILNTIDGKIYIGANATLRRISLKDKEVGVVEDLTIDAIIPDLVISCEDRTADFDVNIQCWNYIRFVEKTSLGNLLVCGTNAVNKLCWACEMDFSGCSPVNGSSRLIGPEIGTEHSATALFRTDQGDILYDGADVVSGEANLYRKYIVGNISGIAPIVLDAQTQSLSGRFIFDPTFVGKPFLYNAAGTEYVYLVYRETALEYQGVEETQYTRIARVCLNDAGQNGTHFTTFVKARLVCSIPGSPSFFYNDVQDMLFDAATDSVYAVFTTEEIGPKASALCRYRMVDINERFDNGVTEGGSTTDGQCDAPYDPPNQANNILMTESVDNFNEADQSDGMTDPPLIYVDGARFTSLTLDRLSDHEVFFFGTSEGDFIKVYNSTVTGKYTAVEFDIQGTSDPLSAVIIIEDSYRYLVLPTSTNATSIPITQCSNGPIQECQRDAPYCEAINGICSCSENEVCPPTSDNGFTPLLQIQPTMENLTVCNNEDMAWFCHLADSNPFVDTTGAVVNWTTPSSVSTGVVQTKNRSPTLVELSIVMTKGHEGEYQCNAYLNDGTTPLQLTFTLTYQECNSVDTARDRCDEHQRLEEQSKSLNSLGFNETDNQCEAKVDQGGCPTCP